MERIQKMNEEERTASAGEIIEAAYNAYFRDVYKFVFRRIGNKAVAEDITHDVFCAALNKMDEFRNHPEPKKWLMVTARNKMRELYRKMKRNASEALEEIPELAVEEPDYNEIELELTALSIIDKEDWELIKDYYLIGITTRELAEKYGITENNMRVRLHRLKVKLRKKIDR